ncbi:MULTISPECIES: mannosyltransferase family protein [Nostocales]
MTNFFNENITKLTAYTRKNKYQIKKILFVIAMWLSSRFVIAVTMLLIAPLLPAPANGIAATFSWDVFTAWDSVWYQQIATNGYQPSDNGALYSTAFFPLFPLIIRIFMNLGLPFAVAGTLINNLAFLAALIILYFWVNESYGKSAARWTTAVLAWCPYSLYGTVVYTEGLFLLCSISALRAFDKRQYISTVFWGGLATATRVTGITLIPAFLFVSWKEGRGLKAYIASLGVGSGFVFYNLYCQIKFGDALAFLHAQKGWRSSVGFDWQGWRKMLMQIVVGSTSGNGYIQNLLHPLLFTIIVCSSYLLWRFRSKLGATKVRYAFYFLWILLWLLTRNSLPNDPFKSEPLIKILLIFGGVYLLWFSRNKIPLVAVIYGFLSYGLILNTGLTASVERYAYGIVSLSFAFGLLLARYPRWGYAIMGFFAIVLATFSIRFSQELWLA